MIHAVIAGLMVWGTCGEREEPVEEGEEVVVRIDLGEEEEESAAQEVEAESAVGDEGAAGMPARGERKRVRETPPEAPDDQAAAPEARTEGPRTEVGVEVGSVVSGGLGIGERGIGIGGRGGGKGRGLGGRGDGRGTKVVAKRNKKAKSKARPPRLIYPKRRRDEIPGRVFVVMLSIDEDGYVDGVRLRQGVNPHDDAKALEAVWRFRYAPALDDRGRPISAKLLQRFMLER